MPRRPAPRLLGSSVPAAALLLLLLALSAPSSAAAASSPSYFSAVGGPPPTVLIDPDGTPHRGAPSPSAAGAGVVCVLRSPGDRSSPFGPPTDGSVTASGGGDGDGDGDGGPAILTAPTATLGGGGDSAAAAAASSVAGSIVLTGATAGDVESGLADSRFGRTLSAVFASRLSSPPPPEDAEAGRTLLIVAVGAGRDEDVDVDAAVEAVGTVFEAEAATVGASHHHPALEDLYEVSVEAVRGAEDADRVMAAAAAAASRSPLTAAGGAPLPRALAEAHARASAFALSGASSSDAPSVAAAVLSCDESYARHRRSSRARLAQWSGRAARGLNVERFGREAASLLERTVGGYDRDTAAAAGLGGAAAPYRLEVRGRLRGRTEGAVRGLFDAQVANARRRALRRFESDLLRGSRSGAGGESSEYRAQARRNAAFAFESAVQDLEVPSLGLVRSGPVRDMEASLNDALMTFEDSPAARLRDMGEVQRAAGKERKPTERSVDVKLDLVGMVRPDGYGNLQGFVGYQLPGGNQVTVGFQNDADSPDVISQFGGVRPPFLRVQPKLKLDVEL